MAETDLIKLYSARILALAADIPHLGTLENPQASIKKRSPLCGSTVSVDVVLSDGTVSAFAQDVKACALGQASAAIFGGAVVGATVEQIARLQGQMRAMLRDNGPVPDAPFDGYEVLVPARDYKNRHSSIMLAVDATMEAIESANQDA